MDLKQAGLGVVLFLIFWVFHAGYLNSLGTTSWVLGVVVFGLILWLIGKESMPKQPEDMKELWMFTMAFAVVVTAVMAWGTSFFGLIALTAGMVMSAWLLLFGGAMILAGRYAKMEVTTLVGIIWLFSALLVGSMMNFMTFGLLVGLPFIIYGIMSKE
jgi:hypothetical protein